MAKFNCSVHSLSSSYSYKQFKCRCKDCLSWKRDAAKRTNDKELAKKRSKEWRARNPERSRQNSKNYQKKHPEMLLKWQLKKYGITLEDYYSMLKNQDGRCAICGSTMRGMQHSNHRLCVDHDKDSGKVMGLLCGGCHIGIGHLNHSVELLKNAIKYFKENGDV